MTRIGVLGGGQLGRMLALAGIPLGLEFRFLDPSSDASARVCGELITAAYDDVAALEAFAEGLDVVTFEFENVSLAAASRLAERVPFRPSPRSLELTQDRLLEKRLLRDLGIATAAFAAVDGRASFDAALDQIGLPAVLKTRRLGYDGKGQAVLGDRTEADSAWSRLGGVPLILEEFVDCDRELSSIAVAGAGQTAVYPLVETRQREGVLRSAIAPAPRVAASVSERAEEAVIAVATELGHRGTLALEWFLAGSRLLANEIAPRVHNSGHWSIEGAVTSQFENHLRAICGLPLGEVTTRPSACVNLLGSVPDIASLLALSGAHLHLYGKAARPGRKLGHVTVTAATETARDQRLAAVEALIG